MEAFFDNLTSKMFMPLITLPTRVVKNSKTLIDNIFYNQFTDSIESGNLTVGISDHMPQFCIIPEQIKKKKDKSVSTFRRDFRNLETNNLIEELNKIDWSLSEPIKVSQYTSDFVHSFESLLDKHAPFKKLTKNQMRRNEKPWIDQEILSKIKERDKYY